MKVKGETSTQAPSQTTEELVSDFYSDNPELWEKVLGKTLHYAFGTRDPKASYEDAESHLDYGARSLYPWISKEASVLDVCCGWGGVARLLINERSAQVHGVTPSSVQAEFFQKTNPQAHCSCVDFKNLSINKKFDIALFMESLTHMPEPFEILQKARKLANRIIIRDHFSTTGQGFYNPNWFMRFPSPTSALNELEEAGFSIEYNEVVDVPWGSIASFWYKNLIKTFPRGIPAGQFGTLFTLCKGMLNIPEEGVLPSSNIRLIVAS